MSTTGQRVSRRRFLQAGGAAAAAAGLLAACGDDGGETDEANDAKVLNGVLAFQQGMVAAYARAVTVLAGASLQIGRQFSKQERQHVTALAGAIADLGGTAVKPRTEQQYARLLGLDRFKSEHAALEGLTELEQMAVFNCNAAVPRVTNHDLRAVTAEISTNSAQHVSVLVGTESGDDPARQSPDALVTGVKPTVRL